MEEQENELMEIFNYYKSQKNPESQEQLVSLLREVQELYGCIPEDIQEAISSEFGVKQAVISSIIKLYPSLRSSQKRSRIVVCTGNSCKSQEAQQILDAVRNELKTEAGGRFILSVKECIKNCRTSPNMQIDGDLYTKVKPREVGEILKRYSTL